MSLPRFDRLPAVQRAQILGVARREFASDGFEVVSYNQLILKTGISKTSAYQYFDGKNDLFLTVLDDVARRVVRELGAWEPSPDSDSFWSQFVAGSNRLVTHLVANPDDLALMDAALSRAPGGEADAWLQSLLADGARLGVIDSPLAPALLASVTAAVFDALDRWAVERLKASCATGHLSDSSTIDAPGAVGALARIWGTPPGLRMPTPALAAVGEDLT